MAGKAAFLSGVGLMGRRHLKGLLRGGFRVTAFDPNETSRQAAFADAAALGGGAANLEFTDAPTGEFDVAVFAETAPYRFANVSAFVTSAKAGRYLLEKPVSPDPAEVEAYSPLFQKAGIDERIVSVNLLRRTWDYVAKLKELSDLSPRIHMGVNGGAFGFGCNGIHYIDLFLYLTGCDRADVRNVRIAEGLIASGRGPSFRDYGGEFLLENEKGSFFCSGAADSSASVIFSLRGEHFVAFVDESDLSWRLRVRRPESTAPVYRCGFEYLVAEEGIARVDPMDAATEKWAKGDLQLPTLQMALGGHRVLHSVLTTGGVRPPFAYT